VVAAAVSGGRSLRLLAPAKINLGLRVTGRRADGYHELDSVFVPLDLADEIALEVREAARPEVALRVEGDAAGVPAGASNLAVRAAEAFLARGALRSRVSIRLTKHIPAAAGLGGGSSDAGAVLRGLAELQPDALGGGVLAELALGLGADVPFFLDPRPARVRGVGERIEPLRGLPSLALLLLHPGQALSTAAVYAAFDALRPDLAPSSPLPAAALPKALWGRDPADPAFAGALAPQLANDLEPAALRLCPPVGRLRQRLMGAGAVAVGMSGSGPTLYGVFDDARAAAAALGGGTFPEPLWARVVATLESPRDSR
jgi:4-diphosphocytidyl-2-C-methyl-D-erythritol kinase